MKTLLWKDIRVNRMVLWYALVSLAGVYFVAAAVNVYGQIRYGFPVKEWPEMLNLAAVLSLVLQLPAAAMFGGCAFAAERADRSAEFLAYLPIPRGKAVLSKAVLALGVLTFIWAVNSSVSYAMNTSGKDMSEVEQTIGMMGVVSLCMFGTAWLCSAVSSSHALSAAVGVLVPVTLGLGAVGVSSLAGWPDASVERWLPRVFAATGVVCFLGGARYYVWRVEP